MTPCRRLLAGLRVDRIREYEDRVYPWPDTRTTATRLALLMEQHGLRQCDLSAGVRKAWCLRYCPANGL